MRSLSILLALFLLSGVAPVVANDGVASIGAGGIVLEKTDDIHLRSEYLRISVDRIDVTYEFENATDRDVTLTLAFPFPDIFADDIDNQWPDEGAAEFVGFTTRFDGKPVQATKVVEIIGLDGGNLTQLFRREGLPLDPLAEIWRPAIYYSDDPRARRVKDRLMALGLLGNFGSREWKVRLSYVWQATFAAHSRVRVNHTYRPITGAFLLALEPDDAGFVSWFRDTFCVGDALMADLAAVAPDIRYSRHARDVRYLLTPGANWAGPIGDFRVVIESPSPDHRVSLCWDGAFRQSSPTTREFRARDFLPARDMVVAFIPPLQAH